MDVHKSTKACAYRYPEKDQKVAAFSEIGLSALCAQRSVKRPTIASRVNIAIDSGSKPMCGVFPY